ncbi:BON domain-containing protein [Trinickia mobilis]|uniref:BON domain-containing protein n=1 Tax=Trinickia mobilis TaxID=2816356 RepID=UPI001A8E56FF|nr:BON domain-containing protein [Trinickia mobilis]
MKAIQAIKLASGALLVAVSVSAWAQASDTGMASAPAMSSMKAEHKADRMLSRKVRGALAKAKGVTAANIEVKARSGAVILEGSVPDQSQVDKATQVAQGVAGVTSVKNALTVKAEGQ